MFLSEYLSPPLFFHSVLREKYDEVLYMCFKQTWTHIMQNYLQLKWKQTNVIYT